jgi:hypothetical protein
MLRILTVASLCALLCACAGASKDTTPAVSLPAAPPPGEPPDIAGINSQALRVAFGRPALVRKEGAAEMWRYDGSGCKAFFFLYSDGTALAVKHVETLPRGSVMAADANCLAQLRIRPAAPTPSS